MGIARRVVPLIAIAIAVALGVGFLAITQVVPAESRYFPETGQTVREPFFSYFEEKGGIEVFGFPLTEVYVVGGSQVQTFQRAQLKLTPLGVKLAPIARDLHLGDGQIHQVASEFADFYYAHGGEGFLGAPLSGLYQEGDLLVQDFECARLIRDPQGQVRLANLGSMYLTVFPPPVRGQAAPRRDISLTPPKLYPHVSVEQPTVAQGGQQTIYLHVEDENGNPVAGVQALAVLRYDGKVAEVTLPDTDDRGLASATFIVPPATPGAQVVIEMHLLYGESILTIETTYFQWW